MLLGEGDSAHFYAIQDALQPSESMLDGQTQVTSHEVAGPLVCDFAMSSYSDLPTHATADHLESPRVQRNDLPCRPWRMPRFSDGSQCAIKEGTTLDSATRGPVRSVRDEIYNKNSLRTSEQYSSRSHTFTFEQPNT